MVLYSQLMFYVMTLVSSSLWLPAGATRIEDDADDIPPEKADYVKCQDDDVTCSVGDTTCVLEFAKDPESFIYYGMFIMTLDCSTLSNPKATITWRREGRTQIRPIEDKYIIEDYTLTIKSLVREDEGRYACFVSNQCGNISYTFVVTAPDKVPMVEIIKNQTAAVGENVIFSCKIIKSESLPIMLIWVKHYQVNGSLTNDGRKSYANTLRDAVLYTINEPQQLVLTGVTLEDAGWYDCVVANTFGNTHRSAYLEVLNKTELSTPLDVPITTAATNVNYDVPGMSSNKNDGLHQKIVFYSTVGGSVVIALVLVIVLLYIIRKKRSHTSAESAIPESYPLEHLPRVSNVSAEINVDQINRRISSGIANSSDLYLPWDIANASDFYLPSSVVNSSDSC